MMKLVLQQTSATKCQWTQGRQMAVDKCRTVEVAGRAVLRIKGAHKHEEFLKPKPLSKEVLTRAKGGGGGESRC